MAFRMNAVQKRTLPNGLTVLLCPNPRVDLACVLTWVNTGYFHETDAESGIAHLIEHLMFKGTTRRGVGEIAGETKRLGGYLNASTTYDHTSYHAIVPAASLVAAIDIQADVFMDPLFDADEIEREKQVVIQEMRRKLDQPHAFAREKLFELAFARHRMRRWRIGTEEGLLPLTRADVRGFYDRNYTPSNAIVAVSGSFDPEKILPEIESRYGSMPARAPERAAGPTEPPQAAAKMARLCGDLSQVIVKMGFHTADVHHPDFAALSCLNILLGKGRSSRLFKALKEEKQLVHGIGSSQFGCGDVGFFTIEAEAKPEEIARTEEEVWAELDRLRKDPPTEEEMQKVRAIVESNFFREKEDMLGQAYGYAYFESLGGFEKMEGHVHRLRAQTPESVLGVLDRYFHFDNMSLLEYVPRSLGSGADAANRLESLQKRIAKRGRSAAAEDVPVLAPAAPLAWEPQGAPMGFADPEVLRLENGMTLIHQHAPGLPLVSVHAYFPGGRLDESERNCGITQFLLRATLKGTENRTADEIFFALESMGSSIQVESNADHFGYAMSALSGDFDRAMEILSDVVLNPTLPEPEIEKERALTLSVIRRIRDDMFHHPIELFYRALYGSHSYGLPRNGSEASAAHFSKGTLLDWYSQIFAWKKMVVSVVGDVSKKEAMEVVTRHFAIALDSAPVAIADVYPLVPERGAREWVESRDKRQTAVALGFEGVNDRDPRFPTFEVLRNVLSGMGGRLFLAMRERKPLVYTVNAFNLGLFRGGAFFVYFACSPERETESRQVLLRELERLCREPVGADELAAAKAFTVGSHSMSLQTNAMTGFSHVHQYLSQGRLEKAAEFNRRIEEVTPQMVRKAAEDLFRLDQHVCGIVRGASS